MGTIARINILWWWDPSLQKKAQKNVLLFIELPPGVLLFCFMKNVKWAWVFVCKLKDSHYLRLPSIHLLQWLLSNFNINKQFLSRTNFFPHYIHFLKNYPWPSRSIFVIDASYCTVHWSMYCTLPNCMCFYFVQPPCTPARWHQLTTCSDRSCCRCQLTQGSCLFTHGGLHASVPSQASPVGWLLLSEVS